MKLVQVRYRVYYTLKNNWNRVVGQKQSMTSDMPSITSSKFPFSIPSIEAWLPHDEFVFLNFRAVFEDRIDWNFANHGKLWVYNLNYFEYLHQKNFSTSEGLRLINDFIDNSNEVKDGMEPFPISLRIINWIKFLANRNIMDHKVNQSLYGQLKILQNNLEYHLLGNHLLENGFALLFAGIYFNNEKIIQKAKSILLPQLKEQILEDGGHFERSPMYHQIMLFRILDSINMIRSNERELTAALLPALTKSASKMISWLKQMTYSNGDIPLLNDSANGIAPTSNQLFKYSEQLKIKEEQIPLGISGYRKVSFANTELIMDIGEVGPSYQPGHAHSDTFNFELRINRQPFIVDTGTSTYEKSPRRNLERSTVSHNTVQVGTYEQSEVWGGFRVARRAIPSILNSSNNQITVAHDGYKRKGYTHERTFEWGDNKVEIIDKVKGGQQVCRAFIHFHPMVKIDVEQQLITTNMGKIAVIGAAAIVKEDYQYADRFNNTIQSNKLVLIFKEELKISISW